MLPPRIVRRLLLAPLLLVVTVALAVTLPPLLLLAAAVSPWLPGRSRALRLLWFGLAWRVLESAALAARPVIVLSRHAGPGDSFLLVHRLLTDYRRRPRVVLKALLQLDPGLDVVINRLPHAFVSPRRGGEGRVTREIERLAASLGPTGALVVFPEGGNFTQRRRLRAIERLERRQLAEQAARARAMKHLLAPRTGATVAALAAAPGADVVFVAHTGLEDLVTVGDIWRSLPMEQVLKARWWRVPATEVPHGREAQVRWLYDWWARIDEWVAENRPVPLPRTRAGLGGGRTSDRTVRSDP